MIRARPSFYLLSFEIVNVLHRLPDSTLVDRSYSECLTSGS